MMGRRDGEMEMSDGFICEKFQRGMGKLERKFIKFVIFFTISELLSEGRKIFNKKYKI